MITIKNLTKKYGSVYAIKDLTFEVNKGEIVGFLGPNGAGKSTTMNILTGYIPATSGQVSIAGYSIMGEPLEVKKRIGYLPEMPPLYMNMRVYEYLKYVAKLKKVPKKEIAEQIKDVMDKLKIVDVKDRMIKNLSKGYKQRVGFAQALLGHPEVLILDEPTVGLDPQQIIEIRELIKNLGKEHTVILSSHILSEVSAVCSRVIIINKGEIVAEDTPSNLSNLIDNRKKLHVVLEGSKDASIDMLRQVEGVLDLEVIEEADESVTYKLECDPQVDVEKNIFFVLAEKKIPLKEIKNIEISLEDVFLEIIKSNKKYNEENENSSVDGDVEGVDSIDNADEEEDANDSIDNADDKEEDANDSIDNADDEEEDANDSIDNADDEEEDANDSIDNADDEEDVSDNIDSVDNEEEDANDSVQQENEGDKDDTNI